ncbi:Fat-like cadherin-related tumor suppressor-like protein [Ooceraea biroi]|uniref:Fat-like cadherin-related tumor suppressor-like protein n=1 Tax=Ooceraea biroi TaxID=2015173 RepID=A0A026WJG5_OOCBI|nr:Fat-like cadherin-related tumor suppressor-like protein [Ooceraea biroi]
MAVTVRDDGRPPLSSTTRVVIEVADVNDHGPVFEQKFYTVQIPASPATDKTLFQMNGPGYGIVGSAMMNGLCVSINAKFYSRLICRDDDDDDDDDFALSRAMLSENL